MESISQETVLAPIPQQGSTCYPTGERSCSRPLQHMCRCLRLFLCCMLWRGMNSAAAHRRNADRPSSSRNILSQAKNQKDLKLFAFCNTLTLPSAHGALITGGLYISATWMHLAVVDPACNAIPPSCIYLNTPIRLLSQDKCTSMVHKHAIKIMKHYNKHVSYLDGEDGRKQCWKHLDNNEAYHQKWNSSGFRCKQFIYISEGRVTQNTCLFPAISYWLEDNYIH